MFFDREGSEAAWFDMYTPMHVLMLVLFTALIVLFFVFKDKMYQSEKEKQIRYGFGYFFIGLEIIAIITIIANGDVYLPLHLCSISYYLMVILLFTKNDKVFTVLFFTGIIGGLVTFAIPELEHAGYDRFHFYQFIIAHAAIILVPLYFFMNHKYTINFKKLLYTLLFVNVVGFLMLPVNLLLDSTGIVPDANYMYMMGPPSDVEAVFGQYPWHILSFELTLLITFTLLFYISNIYRNKKSNQQGYFFFYSSVISAGLKKSNCNKVTLY